MKKLTKIIIILSIILISVAACTVIKLRPVISPITSMSPEERQKIKDKDEHATIDYFKKEKNVDVVVTDMEFSGELGGGSIFVNGHYTNDKAKIFAVTVYSKDDYTVQE
ncbi:hypothetical protein [Bacillus cereus group sp. BfR-BA-01380]|uniref:hypothetical protein n=1 Tax=Bacillus cereus group sp. BfR-BA-01380 TaxID=2920324 RepID=UPI001F593265|nr:hypothetical protein [Bacillus cereus group sp. BfR-BA-01380]